MKAEKRTWRERRGDGLGQTVYTGLLFRPPGFSPFLMSELSHGLRTFEASDESRFVFEGEVALVEVPDILFEEAKTARVADLRFQQQSSLYRQIISGQ